MITTRHVMLWLRSMFPTIDWATGAIDKGKDEAVGVYARRHGLLQPKTMNGPAGYGVKAISLLIRWGTSATPCEEKAIEIYERLQSCSTQETIGGRKCWVDARQAPVLIGKGDRDIFEMCIRDSVIAGKSFKCLLVLESCFAILLFLSKYIAHRFMYSGY